MDKVLVVIKGGTVVEVQSTTTIDLVIIDLDNYSIGEEYLLNEVITSTPENELEDAIDNYLTDIA